MPSGVKSQQNYGMLLEKQYLSYMKNQTIPDLAAGEWKHDQKSRAGLWKQFWFDIQEILKLLYAGLRIHQCFKGQIDLQGAFQDT